MPTFILAAAALIIWIGLAILIGVYAAIRRYSLFDNLATIFAYIGYAIPTFWLGIMLVYIFGTARILPVSGMVDIRVSPAFGNDAYWVYFGQHPISAILDVAKHLVLPVITLVVVNIAGDSRFVRASMLDALNQDYVRTAKAKGLPGRTRHVQARAAKCAAAGRDKHRSRDPVPVHGRDHHRDDLLVAGHRQADDRCDDGIRLPGPDGGPARHLAHSWFSRTSLRTSPTRSSTRASSTRRSDR